MKSEVTYTGKNLSTGKSWEGNVPIETDQDGKIDPDAVLPTKFELESYLEKVTGDCFDIKLKNINAKPN